MYQIYVFEYFEEELSIRILSKGKNIVCMLKDTHPWYLCESIGIAVKSMQNTSILIRNQTLTSRHIVL